MKSPFRVPSKTRWRVVTSVLLFTTSLLAGEDSAIESNKELSSPFRISQQRLDQLKKGIESSYLYYKGDKEAGGANISLKYDPREKTFTYLQSVNLQDHYSKTTVVFSAEEKPELKSFSVADPDDKHLIEGRVTNGKLIGKDQDGDPYEIPYHSEFLPSLALNFVVMAVDWSAENSLRVRIFDEKVQDLLPSETLLFQTETRTIQAGQMAIQTRAVSRGRDRYWIDGAGQIVDIDFSEGPCRLRLGEPAVIEQKSAEDESSEDDEKNSALLAELLKSPPATGVAISQVISKSQAARAGLAVGDIIVKYGGNAVATRAKLEDAKKKSAASRTPKIDLEVLRDSKPLGFSLAPGTIGIQTLDVVKDVPVDMVTAEYGSMGFGPGPKPPPSPLEVLARKKCGSLIPWLKNFAEARKRSTVENKVLLWWASPIHGSATYKIESWNDYLSAGLFTDPWLAAYITRNFIPYFGPLNEKQMDGYKRGFMTAPAFVFLSPDGELIHEIDGLSTISVEYFAKVFQNVLRIPGVPPGGVPDAGRNARDTTVSATLNYIEALLADFEPNRAASEAKKAAGSFVGDDRCEALYLQGRALQMLHKESEAVDALQLAWDEARDIRIKSLSLAELGLVHLRAGHPDRALKTLRQPLSEYLAGPRAIEARYLEGVALYLLNRDQEAHRVWTAAAESNSGDPWAWRCAAEAEGIGPFDKGFESVYWVPDDAVRSMGVSPIMEGNTQDPHGRDTHAANLHSTEYPARDSAEAIGVGVRYLLQNQSSDGGWNDTNYDFGGLRAMPNVRVAVTAICCEALLAQRDANPHAIDAAIEKAWPYLIDHDKMTWDDKNEIIWAHLYRMNFFAAWLKTAPSQRRAEILHQMQLIADAFANSQNKQGFWRHEYDNDFVTGSVLISLKLAKDSGVVVSDEAIDKGASALDKMRSPRGTFPYGDKPTDEPVAWKGCIGRTVNAEAALLAWGRNNAERLRESIEKYMQWNFVQERVRKETFHSDRYRTGGFFFWFNMHVLSQAVRLTDAETASRAAKSMRQVVLQSREFDGTWIDSYDLGKSYATGMALLVLAAADGIDP